MTTNAREEAAACRLLEMPNPTETDLTDPLFEAVWQAIKSWDVNVPSHYVGYCGANGSHAMLILESVRAVLAAADGVAGVPAGWRELAERCLRSMNAAVHYGMTREGRPPQQTCLFEIRDLEAMLGATPSPAQPKPAQGVSDERAAFEAWADEQKLAMSRHHNSYAATSTAWCWDAWRGRAALTKPPVSVSDEQIDALMPRQVWNERLDYIYGGDQRDEAPLWSREQVRATVRAALSALGGGVAEKVRRNAARYEWLCANSFDKSGATQMHCTLHTWEPHSLTGKPSEWVRRIRGPALDRFIDAAIAAAPQPDAGAGAEGGEL